VKLVLDLIGERESIRIKTGFPLEFILVETGVGMTVSQLYIAHFFSRIGITLYPDQQYCKNIKSSTDRLVAGFKKVKTEKGGINLSQSTLWKSVFPVAELPMAPDS
jgi:hypothetical protein